MDRMNNSKATPTKRTGVKNTNDMENRTTMQEQESERHEIGRANSPNASPNIPVEMPVRENR